MDEPPARDEQAGQHRPLAWPAEVDGIAVVVVDLDRAENPELHPCPPVILT
ncbi:hypothetical protein ACQP2K_05765 [Microbispora siamensis]